MRIGIAAVAGALLFHSVSFGYVRLVTNLIGDASPAPLYRTDNTGIQFLVNANVVAGAQSSASGKNVNVISATSNPLAAIRAALATWNAAGANVTFLPLQTTSLGIDSSDGSMVVAIGSSASDLSLVGGALAVTVPSYATSAGLHNGVNVDKGTIFDTDIIINPQYPFSTDGSANTYDLQSAMLHEFGHSLGANHTGLVGATMFQFPTERFLSTDDLTFAAAVYPLPGGAATPLGTISGTVTAGGTGAAYALLTATDTSAGNTVSGVTKADGTYSFQAPPGTYQIYAEPLNGVTAINIYLSPDQLALATKFQTTVYSGNVTVGANTTAVANIAVTPGTATLSPIYAYVSAVNGAAGSGSPSAPMLVPSGQSVDLILAGTGFDATLSNANFTIFGKGITLHAGSVRVDKTGNVGGFNLLRVTLDVAAATSPSLGSIVVTSGASTISLSGALVIVPPTPTFVSAGVISAAPYTGIQGGVTPGGIYSIYDVPNAPNLGPSPYVQNGPYDAYGNLATTLGGVTVTFDGVPAPMFLSYAGQLNFQVPFEVAGKSSTKVVVNFLGSPSAAVSVPVLTVQPSFFTTPGTTAVRAYNLADGTINSAQAPAARGTFVEVYGTGVGKVSYAIATGHGAPSLPTGYTGNYTYSVGGSPAAPALFGGYTPTAVGLAQWDLQIPTGSATGAVSISVTDPSGVSSPTGMTIFVK
jgi:uncharacterized protein (TIGR03437 family)